MSAAAEQLFKEVESVLRENTVNFVWLVPIW